MGKHSRAACEEDDSYHPLEEHRSICQMDSPWLAPILRSRSLCREEDPAIWRPWILCLRMIEGRRMKWMIRVSVMWSGSPPESG